MLKIISDIDECAMDDDDCSANAHCTNTPGSFDCACNQGYTGNGVTCIGKWCEMHIGGANQIYVLGARNIYLFPQFWLIIFGASNRTSKT